jgi:ornithine cyclodeaminase
MEKQLKVRILSKNQVISLGGGDMENIIKDIENILSLHDKGDVISPNKAVMVWGKTPEDEILYGRINAMPAYVGGSYDMPGIKWIGSDPNNLKLGFPRASATIILNDRKTSSL